jgi:hypothetical protein
MICLFFSNNSVFFSIAACTSVFVLFCIFPSSVFGVSVVVVATDGAFVAIIIHFSFIAVS